MNQCCPSIPHANQSHLPYYPSRSQKTSFGCAILCWWILSPGINSLYAFSNNSILIITNYRNITMQTYTSESLGIKAEVVEIYAGGFPVVMLARTRHLLTRNIERNRILSWILPWTKVDAGRILCLGVEGSSLEDQWLYICFVDDLSVIFILGCIRHLIRRTLKGLFFLRQVLVGLKSARRLLYLVKVLIAFENVFLIY